MISVEPGGRWNFDWRYSRGESSALMLRTVATRRAGLPSGPLYAAAVDDLFRAAVAVQANAHVPYSHFPVGAAIRTASGRIFAACNVENAAFPQGTCAEAGAIAAMVSAGEREIVEVLTVASGARLTTCCGGCRQKLREFADDEVVVHAAGPEGVRRSFTMGELLPASFGPAELLERDGRS